MKRLIALLIGALIAIGYNLEPITPVDAEYAPDNHYEVAQKGEVDYRRLYSTYYNTQVVNTNATCNTSLYRVNAAQVPLQDSINVCNTNYYWFLSPDPDKKDPEEIGDVLVGDLVDIWNGTDKEGWYIVAPADSTIITSHNNCDFGKTMAIEVSAYGQKYTITFNNLKCWWCCRGKATPEDGKYTLSAGVDDPKGTVIPKGRLLAIATKNTTVTIHKSNYQAKEIALSDFYNLSGSK